MKLGLAIGYSLCITTTQPKMLLTATERKLGVTVCAAHITSLARLCLLYPVNR